MGKGLDIQIDEAPEIAEAIEAAVGGEIGIAALAEELAEGVDITVTFASGGIAQYKGVPVDIAVRVTADPSQYNSLLRGSGYGV